MTGPLHEGDPKAYQYHPRPIIPEDFPWRHGMTALLYGRRWLLQWVSLPDAGYGHLYRIAGDCRILFTKEEQAAATPDPTDGATLGALLAAVRETMGPSRPGSANGYCAQEIGLLVARYLIGAESPEKVFAALLATWEARPR